LGQSKSFKIIVLGTDNFFIEEVISIIGIRHLGSCVILTNFEEVQDHFSHSIPPEGIIIQSGHPDFQNLQDYILTNDLNLLMTILSPDDFIKKIDSYFLELNKWFSEVSYLPVFSNMAGFIGYTPVVLFVKTDKIFKEAVSAKTFISETMAKKIFLKGEGFFFIKKEDYASYKDNWQDASLAYFKSQISVGTVLHGPVSIILPVIESKAFHGIPESDQYLLRSALERIGLFLEKYPELSTSIEKLLMKNNYQLKHTSFLMCMNVATLSAMEVDSPVIYFNMTLAGLIHDLGTINYGFEEYEFHEFAMSKVLDEETISRYSKHAEQSLSLLLKYQVCPKWIAEMVLSHHENDSGFGYPLGIQSSSMGLVTFIFAFNHEWAEKLYGYLSKEKHKSSQSFFVESMPTNSLKALDLKSNILEYLKITAQ